MVYKDEIRQVAFTGVNSAELFVANTDILAVALPAGFAGTTLALQAKSFDGTWLPVYTSSGTIAQLTVAASRVYVLPTDWTRVGNSIRFVSGASETGRLLDIYARSID